VLYYTFEDRRFALTPNEYRLRFAQRETPFHLRLKFGFSAWLKVSLQGHLVRHHFFVI
jgi:hypothetical protein